MTTEHVTIPLTLLLVSMVTQTLVTMVTTGTLGLLSHTAPFHCLTVAMVFFTYIVIASTVVKVTELCHRDVRVDTSRSTS